MPGPPVDRVEFLFILRQQSREVDDSRQPVVVQVLPISHQVVDILPCRVALFASHEEILVKSPPVPWTLKPMVLPTPRPVFCWTQQYGG